MPRLLLAAGLLVALSWSQPASAQAPLRAEIGAEASIDITRGDHSALSPSLTLLWTPVSGREFSVEAHGPLSIGGGNLLRVRASQRLWRAVTLDLDLSAGAHRVHNELSGGSHWENGIGVQPRLALVTDRLRTGAGLQTILGDQETPADVSLAPEIYLEATTADRVLSARIEWVFSPRFAALFSVRTSVPLLR